MYLVYIMGSKREYYLVWSSGNMLIKQIFYMVPLLFSAISPELPCSPSPSQSQTGTLDYSSASGTSTQSLAPPAAHSHHQQSQQRHLPPPSTVHGLQVSMHIIIHWSTLMLFWFIKEISSQQEKFSGLVLLYFRVFGNDFKFQFEALLASSVAFWLEAVVCFPIYHLDLCLTFGCMFTHIGGTQFPPFAAARTGCYAQNSDVTRSIYIFQHVISRIYAIFRWHNAGLANTGKWPLISDFYKNCLFLLCI